VFKGKGGVACLFQGKVSWPDCLKENRAWPFCFRKKWECTNSLKKRGVTCLNRRKWSVA
jgi:hypothetical protein